MRIIAVDDERIALERLMESIEKAEPKAAVWGFRDPEEALTYMKKESCDIAFLDIRMKKIHGIRLAQEMKLIYPKINIIFTTGYDEYYEDAFGLHASGYLLKPVTPEKIRNELEDLRHPLVPDTGKRVRFQTFGYFEMFVDEKPVSFYYDKTKEMVAYLVNRHGTLCTNNEIMTELWQDDRHSSYLRHLKKDFMDTLKKLECEDIVVQGRGKIGILVEKVDCDYYDWKNGKIYALNAYHGEYMAQYGWAEITNGSLFMEKEK
ncbi:MAG: response regulator [Blautia sp.]|nr:response regulator [Clostridia bacterium]MDY4693027.1 response regulator [Blautia sp.]MDY5555762.1 response regulator [Blautia sp.]